MTRKESSRNGTPERHRKPEIPRTEPIRSWSTLFGAPGAPGIGVTGPKVAVDSVKRGVELGYRVIDDYIKQGTSVANAFAGPGRGQVPSTQDLPKMAERMMQYGSDFASIWFDAMAVMVSNFDGAGAGRAPDAAPPGSPPRAQTTAKVAGAARPFASPMPAPRFSLHIHCSQPTEVLVTLDELISSSTLVVEDLRARSGTKKIKGAAIEMPESPAAAMRIRVEVPQRMPPGRYSGAILDSVSKNPRGRLTVTLGP